MKVFISWSGERSRAIAEALRYWLPKVIQAVQPWMSANDIDKGTRWRAGLTNELEQSSIGIICLTPENLESSWIHFEAGALSKQQQNTYVCTFLYGLEPVDLREPLAQFQTTKAQKEDTKKLIQTINNARGEKRLPESEIEETFDVWWPKLEERFEKIPAVHEGVETQRDVREILKDILELVRAQARASQILEREVLPSVPRIFKTLDLPEEDLERLLHYYNRQRERLESLMNDEREALSMLRRLKRDDLIIGRMRARRAAQALSTKTAVVKEDPPDENSNS